MSVKELKYAKGDEFAWNVMWMQNWTTDNVRRKKNKHNEAKNEHSIGNFPRDHRKIHEVGVKLSRDEKVLFIDTSKILKNRNS